MWGNSMSKGNEYVTLPIRKTTTVEGKDTMPALPTVRFTVHTVDEHRDDHWAVTSEETGITTYGSTREEALRLNRDANVGLISLVKLQGTAFLEKFLTERDIAFRISGEGTVVTAAPSPPARPNRTAIELDAA